MHHYISVVAAGLLAVAGCVRGRAVGHAGRTSHYSGLTVSGMQRGASGHKVCIT